MTSVTTLAVAMMLFWVLCAPPLGQLVRARVPDATTACYVMIAVAVAVNGVALFVAMRLHKGQQRPRIADDGQQKKAT